MSPSPLDVAPSPPSDTAPVTRRGWRPGPLELAGLSLVVLLVGRALFLEPFFVPTTSMAPTVRAGEHVLVRHDVDGADLRGGEVALVRAPQGELMVKRVVAVGGQRVGLRDGRLVVDGEVQHEAYADPEALDSIYFGPVDVPAGHVFVLGDNRFGSEDSRVYGSLPVEAVEGTVLGVWWPLDAARWVE